jgi:hypothetical protein
MVEGDGGEDDQTQVGHGVVAGVAEGDRHYQKRDDDRGHEWPLEPSRLAEEHSSAGGERHYEPKR